MMDYRIEIDSFAFKFKQLWRRGLQADLQLKCDAGQALIHLQVGLGYVSNSSSQSSYIKSERKHVTLSQIRRRIRREYARRKSDASVPPPEECGENFTCKNYVEAIMEIVEEVNVAESSDNEPVQGCFCLKFNDNITEVANNSINTFLLANQVEVYVSTEEAHSVGQVTGGKTIIANDEVDLVEASQVIDNLISNSYVETVENVTGAAAQASSAMEKYNTVKQLPEIVVIHAEACFECCPKDILSRTTWNH